MGTTVTYFIRWYLEISRMRSRYFSTFSVFSSLTLLSTSMATAKSRKVGIQLTYRHGIWLCWFLVVLGHSIWILISNGIGHLFNKFFLHLFLFPLFQGLKVLTPFEIRHGNALVHVKIVEETFALTQLSSCQKKETSESLTGALSLYTYWTRHFTWSL